MNNYTLSIKSIALESKFNKEDIPALLSVVEETPNPETAIEILLGIYQEPTIFKFAKDGENEAERTLVGFKPISQTVTYTYFPIKSKEAWFRKDEENLCEATIASTNRWQEDAAEHLGITIEELRENYAVKTYSKVISDTQKESSVNLSSWNYWGEREEISEIVDQDIF